METLCDFVMLVLVSGSVASIVWDLFGIHRLRSELAVHKTALASAQTRVSLRAVQLRAHMFIPAEARYAREGNGLLRDVTFTRLPCADTVASCDSSDDTELDAWLCDLPVPNDESIQALIDQANRLADEHLNTRLN